MKILNDLQKIIYNKLSNIEEINVFSCPEKNTNFPYLIINIDNIEIEDNFYNTSYSLILKLLIFDKNESNINIINISEKVKNNIIELNNNFLNNITKIININFINSELKLFNEINSIWNMSINLNLIIQQQK